VAAIYLIGSDNSCRYKVTEVS